MTSPAGSPPGAAASPGLPARAMAAHSPPANASVAHTTPAIPGICPRPGAAMTSSPARRLVMPSPKIVSATKPIVANASAIGGRTGPADGGPAPSSAMAPAYVGTGSAGGVRLRADELRPGLERALVLALRLDVELRDARRAGRGPGAEPDGELAPDDERGDRQRGEQLGLGEVAALARR